ncbi:uncharacterized protein SAPINGB_P005668 [Magnusiomyces paraingens]|uniref:Autophagy-related protein 27 n=1 Tax=Magnusiomyces paraingens TaxID=2606893 RepID=A0A5E8C153_9ASCO|nr:uncharacterized protein SAPINGB_P005668 [Saprochaete ingens]VVT57383.1 unnamed protein product [Saprochaete ingens]
MKKTNGFTSYIEYILLLLAITSQVVLATLNCDIHVDGVSFNLAPLQGTYQINSTISTPPSTNDFTWLFDPCASIIRENDKLPFSSECPDGSQICGIQRVMLPGSDPLLVSIIPVAGDFDGKQTGARIELIKEENSEKSKGLRVSLKGSSWGESTQLQGIIEFICPASDGKNDISSLPKYVSWDLNSLRLTWTTKYACENAITEPGNGDHKGDNKDDNNKGDDDSDKNSDNDESKSWGWFTWLFIIGVLGSATYIIAGSWINYNRYGLSGVDILPHADLLRDLPFLIRDVIRKIAGTFSAGNSRGGYSAV